MLDLTPSLQYNVIAALSPRTSAACAPSNRDESRWVKRYIMCPWPLAHGAHACAGLPMQIPQERACHSPDMTHQPQGAGGRARRDDGAAEMRDASRTDTPVQCACVRNDSETIRCDHSEIVRMLDLTPSLQYTVIAALSPNLQSCLFISNLQRDILIVVTNGSGQIIVIAVNCNWRVVAWFEFA